ncbi:uncharacterized protein LOC114257041 [Camellia sinensis]|uniref:uncharacterized protein LOC114257041 n=1 Tax=Camellia sinensis TaxID=4442 RepID=UPI0010366426|nr:uncharacterized protein LOC114257041 [Camellia sinensis]
MLWDGPGYKKFKVDNDDDIQNMLCLAKSFGLKHFDVLIQIRDVPRGGNYGGAYCHEGQKSNFGNQTFSMDDQTDLLPTYCPNKSKTFLSAQWAFGITHVGQCFAGVCKFAESTGCAWSVHARVLSSNGILCVKKLDSVHNCGAAVRTHTNPRTGSNLVLSVVVDRVRAQPLTRPTDIVFDMKNDYGLDISYRVAWLGVEKVRGQVYGDHAMSFDQLRWYSDSVMEKNPNSYINLEFHQQTGRFVRYFISFRACIDGFNHCRPLLFLDGTFLKGRFKGNLLAATAKDGNKGLFPVAFAIVDSENKQNWEWFLRNLKEVMGDGRTLTFVSNRHASLLQSMPIIFPSAHHAFCLLHLQMNLRDQMKYVNASRKVGLMRKLRECAYALTIPSYNQKIEVLKECNPAVIENFLKELHPSHWANAYFMGQRYGEMWSSAAESFNN